MPVTDQDRQRALDLISAETACIVADAKHHPAWRRLLMLRTGPYLYVRLVTPQRFTPALRAQLGGRALIIDDLGPTHAHLAGQTARPAQLIELGDEQPASPSSPDHPPVHDQQQVALAV